MYQSLGGPQVSCLVGSGASQWRHRLLYEFFLDLLVSLIDQPQALAIIASKFGGRASV